MTMRFLPLVLLFVAGTAAAQFEAQTALDVSAVPPLVTDGIDGPRSVFHVDNAGGFVAEGTLGVGSIPAEGEGTRVLWHPYKAAFRAGTIGSGGTQWDDANVGFYTWAGGYNTVSTGLAAFAMGYQSNARGSYSVAMGYRGRATGTGAVAMGYRSTANGSYSVAIGQRA